jgi:hypothetical protein
MAAAAEVSVLLDKNLECVYVHTSDGFIPGAKRVRYGSRERWLYPRRRVQSWIADLLGGPEMCGGCGRALIP